ncbi:DNA translocase FtsK-like [Triticum dicoccoides]|uniref:DNA translocase FtsK-like n=1 Tax=Triticum dicoccoides TaxID=85692 RepID=UPI00188E2BBD|nr:DNA translocase FtsK-like [Triticum dicoccoides]
MVRKKVPLRYIGEDSNRRRTYETRRNYLMKKVGELGILCNTKACVLVYDEGASEPYVYPSHAEAVEILNRYKAMPNMPQFKKEIHKSLVERIAKTNPQLPAGGQPPVFQPQMPYVTGSADMGCPLMYQAPPQQQAGGQPPVFQPQAPYIAGSADMGPPPMYQAPPHQQEGWKPPVFQPQAQYVTGSIDMGPPPMYQALQQQEGWRNMVRSEGDHSALVYNRNGYSTGGHDGAGTSSGASFPLDDMMSFLDDMEFEL